jgi:hypothetical protein
MTQKNYMLFSGKKSLSYGIFLLISIAGIIFTVIGLPILVNKSIDSTGLLFSSLIGIPVFGLFIWIWISSYYLISKNDLKVKWGPFVWNIPVSEINIIRLNQRTIGGILKPTLSWKSIEIKYKKYRSIFVSPYRQDDFVSRLKRINDKIELKLK